MAQQRHIIDIADTSLRVGSSDTYMPESSTGEKDNQRIGLFPCLPYQGKNILPTSYGYKSFFGVQSTQDATGLPAGVAVHEYFVYQTGQYVNVHVLLTSVGIFMRDVGAWEHVTVLPAPEVGKDFQWSVVTLKGAIFVYRQDQLVLHALEEYVDTASALQENWNGLQLGRTGVTTSTPAGALASKILGVVAITPTFLNMEGQIGIFRAGGSLGFWDSEDAVAWSALNNVADFTPDLTTLANVTSLTDLVGRITTIKGYGAGFVVYATKSILKVEESNNSLQRFSSEPIYTNVGVVYPREVVVAQPDDTHFAWTTAGLVHLELGKPPLVIVPEITDHLKVTRAPMYLSFLNNRHLCIQVLDRDFIEGNVDFSAVTVDPEDYKYLPVQEDAEVVDGTHVDGRTACFTPDAGEPVAGIYPYDTFPGYLSRVHTGPLVARRGTETLREAFGIPSDISDLFSDVVVVSGIPNHTDQQWERFFPTPDNINPGDTQASVEAYQLNAFKVEQYTTYLDAIAGLPYKADVENGILTDWRPTGEVELLTYEEASALNAMASGLPGAPITIQAGAVATAQAGLVDNQLGPLASHIVKTQGVVQLSHHTHPTVVNAWPEGHTLLDLQLEELEEDVYRAKCPVESLGDSGYFQYEAKAIVGPFQRWRGQGGIVVEATGFLGVTAPRAGMTDAKVFLYTPNALGTYSSPSSVGHFSDWLSADGLSVANREFRRRAGIAANPAILAQAQAFVDTLLGEYLTTFAGIGEAAAFIASVGGDMEQARVVGEFNVYIRGHAYSVESDTSLVGDGDITVISYNQDVELGSQSPPSAGTASVNHEVVTSSLSRVEYTDYPVLPLQAWRVNRPNIPASDQEEYGTWQEDARGLIGLGQWMYTGHNPPRPYPWLSLEDVHVLVTNVAHAVRTFGVTEADTQVHAAAINSNRYYVYPDHNNNGVPDSLEQAQVCGITDPISVPDLPIAPVQGTPWQIEVPPLTWVLQNGSIAPVNPTFEGAYTYDLQLKKWGVMVNDYKLLTDYQPLAGPDTHGAVEYEAFMVDAGAVLPSLELALFTETPEESYIRYGKYRHFPASMTAIEEVNLTFKAPATGMVTASTSVDGRRLEYGYTNSLLYTNKLSARLGCDTVGKWHTITVTGHFDLTQVEVMSHPSGRR